VSNIKSILLELRIWFCNFIIAYIPFHFIRLGYYKYIMNFEIGKGSSVHLGCHFNTPGLFIMKENSTINQFCHIDNRGGIEIGNNVSISPKVSLITTDHDLNDEKSTARADPIIIEDFVFIGYDALVLRGCTLKFGSVVGAKSLLTSSTAACGIYLGMPAKLKKTRIGNFNYTGSYKRFLH
jgi:acetyltransferase-like isoleucine patch superfamily enzyme